MDYPQGYRQFEVDGVPVHHFASDDEVCTAVLTFAVGMRDETLPTQGVLHAVEHLVLDTARRTPIEIDGSVDATTTQFVGTGRPALVAAFLATVARSLADLPTDRWPVEAKVLALETAGHGSDAAALLHRVRYGFRDLGVREAPNPRPTELTVAQIRSVLPHFSAANAFLLLDGPVPDDLRLSLPVGPVPPRRWPEPRQFDRPGVHLVEGPACAVGLLLPPADGSGLDLVLTDLVVDRLTEELRHVRGLSYVLDHDVNPVADGRSDLVVWAEPDEDSAVAAVEALVATLRPLLAGAAEPADVTAAVTRVQERRRGRQAAWQRAGSHAWDTAVARPTVPVDPDRLARLGPDAVGAALAALTPTVVMLADERADEVVRRAGLAEVDGGEPTAAPVPGGTTFRPSLVSRALSDEARTAEVVLGLDGVTYRGADRQQTIRFDAVAGFARAPDGDGVLFGLDGTAIPLGAGLYRRGEKLVAAVLDRIAPDLAYGTDDLAGPGPPPDR